MILDRKNIIIDNKKRSRSLPEATTSGSNKKRRQIKPKGFFFHFFSKNNKTILCK